MRAPDYDEEGLELEDDDDGGAPPNWRAWTSMRGAEKLDQFLDQFDWETDLYSCSLHRYSPTEVPKAGKIAGHVEKMHGRMSLEWLTERHRGGTYKITVSGPNPAHNNKVQYLKICNDIVISGPCRIPAGLYGMKRTLEFDADGKPLEGDEENEADVQAHAAGASAGDRLADKLADALLEETKELRRHSMNPPQRASDVETFMRYQESISKTNMDAAVKAQERMDTLMGKIFEGQQQKGLDPSVLDALRQEAEKERRALMDEIDRSRNAAREREADLRRDAQDARESMRKEFDRQYQSLYQSRAEALEQLRSEHQARVATLQDTWAARERDLKDRISELRDLGRTLESRLNSVTRERDEAKLQLVMAQASAGRPAEDPMDGVRKMFGFTQEIMQLTGQAPKEPSLVDHAKEILSTEPAKRVAGGIASMLSGFGSRGSGGGSAQTQQKSAPEQSALEAWERARGGSVATQQQQKRRKKAAPPPQLQPAMPGGAPEPPPEKTPEETIIELTDVDQESAVSVISAIEEAARKEENPESFLAGLELAVGGPGVMKILSHGPSQVLISNLEKSAGMQFSVGAKAYLRKALEVGKEKYK